jgi:hypothetical protein
MPDLMTLQRICGLLDRGEIDHGRFLALLTRHMAQHVGCSRAAVRMLVESPRGALLHCVEMHDLHRSASVAAPDMTSPDPTPYFETLLRDGCVVAADAWQNLTTRPFAPNYLQPLDVRSLLDVAFSVNGTLYGCFSCEQVGAEQAWTPQQLARLRQIASRVSLTLMHMITSQIDTAPGALWEPSTPNRLMTMPLSLDDFED